MKDERRMSTDDLVAAADVAAKDVAAKDRPESADAEVHRFPSGARNDAGRTRDHADHAHDHDHDHDHDHPVDEAERPAPLFVQGDADGYRTRWGAIQTGFVDEPRRAVEEADALVAEVVKRLAEVFADERHRLEGVWEKNDDVSTEDLRQAMRRYRSFFERLLSV
jgi:hypothetical protein